MDWLSLLEKLVDVSDTASPASKVTKKKKKGKKVHGLNEAALRTSESRHFYFCAVRRGSYEVLVVFDASV